MMASLANHFNVSVRTAEVDDDVPLLNRRADHTLYIGVAPGRYIYRLASLTIYWNFWLSAGP